VGAPMSFNLQTGYTGKSGVSSSFTM